MVAKLETIQLMIEGSARITTVAGINMWIYGVDCNCVSRNVVPNEVLVHKKINLLLCNMYCLTSSIASYCSRHVFHFRVS